MAKLIKLIRSVGLGIFFVCFLMQMSGALTKLPSNNTTANPAAKVYLPGDFVHIIVEAPVDTAQITVVMPDASVISLVQGRNSNSWRGIWQVPTDFKKGSYFGKLSAVDVEGNVFDGETDSFDVGELSLITLVGKPSKEAAAKPSLRQIISVEATAPSLKQSLAEGETELINKLMKVLSVSATAPAISIEAEEREALITRNLFAGKDFFDKGKMSEAIAYFRIVLHLSPENKEASLYLVQANDILKRRTEELKQFYILLAIIMLGVIVGLVVLWRSMIKLFLYKNHAAEKGSKTVVHEKDRQAHWFARLGWKKNPFISDPLHQIFVSDKILSLEGLKNFVRGRIEAAGGKNIYPFTETALEKIFDLSKGKLKSAINICDWALEQTIYQNAEQITAEIVKGYEKIGHLNILIVDDDEIIRSSLEAILTKGGGYQTDFAGDGEEAIKKVKENLYGLVLLDVDLPKVDGYAVLKQIRSFNSDLPVIMVTGKGVPQQTVESMDQYNLNGYVQKPFTPEKILNLVAKILRNR